MSDPRLVRVFISSPVDVMPERAIVERVVARVHDVWKGYVRIEAMRWERKHYDAARGFQEAIGEMAAFDVIIGILWKRVGSPLPPDLYRRADGSSYESGTVFELESAIASSEMRGAPAVYLFRKTTPITYTAEGVDEERRQYESLTKWWNRTFRDADGHFRRGYQEFTSTDALEQSIEALLEAYLREQGIIPSGPAWNVEVKGSPYPGLVAYDGAYSDVFFGRSLVCEAAMEELLAAAGRDTPVLFLVGPSGSGKSSLARAGLAARFAGNRIRGVDFWRTLLIEASEDPISGLAQRLYAPSGLPELAGSPHPTPEGFAALARESPENAVGTIKWGLLRAGAPVAEELGGGRVLTARLLVVLDQLETVLDGPDHQALARFLRALVDGEAAWVIATLRSDRYADLQLDADLFALRRRGAMFDLPPPGASEIADIIKGPARAADLTFEERDGDSLAKVVNSAVRGADALPLLQMTLKRLFDGRVGRTLVFAAYEAMGGLEGAIAAHAETVFAGVSPAAQATLGTLLRSLVADIDENGRLTINTPKREAIATDPAARELVDRLIEARLLVNIDGSVRVAHEALLRRWKRATDSPALQPEAIRLRRQIEPNFAAWQRTGLDVDLLQPGTTAIAAADAMYRAHPGVFPPDLDVYVRRSVVAAETRARAEHMRAEAETRRARRTAYAAVAAAVTIGGLGTVAFVVYGQAQRDLSLRLLTKAEQFVIQERPTRTYVAASAAASANVLPNFVLQIGALPEDAGHEVRARSLAEVAAPAGNLPARTLKLANAPRAVAFSADRKRMAIGDAAGQVLVAPVDGAGPSMLLSGHEGPVRGLVFGRGDQMIATAGDDRTVRLWDVASRESRTLCGHRGRVVDLALDRTGRYLASASYDGKVIVWDAAKDYAATAFASKGDTWALAVAFSPDGATLASSDQDGNLYFRDTVEWKTRGIATDRKDLVSIAFSTDGKRVATASINGSLDVWNVATGERIRRIDDFPGKLWKVRFSPDGRLLAAASWDGTIRLWNADTYRYAGTVDAQDHWVNDIAFSGDASLLLSANESGAARIWRTDSIRTMFQTVRDDDRETLVGAYSPDGFRFVTGGRDGLARLYAVDAHGEFQLRCTVPHRDWVVSAAFSADGKTVVSAGTKDGKNDNAISIWGAEDCRLVKSVDVGDQFVSRALLRPDGKQLAWGNRKGEVWLMDFEPLERRSKLPNRHVRDVATLDYSPDGRLLASGGTALDGKSGTVVLWNVGERSFRRELSGGQRRVTAVRFSPDGKILASAGNSNMALLWDTAGGDAPLAKLPMRTAASGALVFSPDGTRLATGTDGRTVDVWLMKSRELVFQLTTLVGVRGVFGFHPKYGDLAFDGESGLVRVLPGIRHPGAHAATMPFEMHGTEIFFDRVPDGVIASENVVSIKNASNRCTVSSMQ